jgi:hypothetical protein
MGSCGPVGAAERVLTGDQGTDEHAALRRGRVEALLVFGEECFELSRIFAGDDLGLGVDAGLQGVEAGCGFTFRVAGRQNTTGRETIKNIFGFNEITILKLK